MASSPSGDGTGPPKEKEPEEKVAADAADSKASPKADADGGDGGGGGEPAAAEASSADAAAAADDDKAPTPPDDEKHREGDEPPDQSKKDENSPEEEKPPEEDEKPPEEKDPEPKPEPEPEPEPPKPDPSLVGRKVKKRFGHKFYWGEIVEIIFPGPEETEEEKEPKEEEKEEEEAKTKNEKEEKEEEATAAGEAKEGAAAAPQDPPASAEGGDVQMGDAEKPAEAEAEAEAAADDAAVEAPPAAEKNEDGGGGGGGSDAMAVDGEDSEDTAKPPEEEEEGTKKKDDDDEKKGREEEENAASAAKKEGDDSGAGEAPAADGGGVDVEMGDAEKTPAAGAEDAADAAAAVDATKEGAGLDGGDETPVDGDCEGSNKAGDGAADEAEEGKGVPEKEEKKAEDPKKKKDDDGDNEDDDDGVFYYRVKFEDGDVEDLETHEALPLLERARRELEKMARSERAKAKRVERERAREEARRIRLEKKFPDGVPAPTRRSKRDRGSHGDGAEGPDKKRAKGKKMGRKKKKKKAKSIFPEPDHSYEMVEFKFISTSSACKVKVDGDGRYEVEEGGSKIGPDGGKKKDLVLGYVRIPLVRDDKTGKMSLPPLDDDDEGDGKGKGKGGKGRGLKVYGTLTRLVGGRAKNLGKKDFASVARRLDDDDRPDDPDQVRYEDFVGRIVNCRVWSDEDNDYKYGTAEPHLELGYYQDPTTSASGDHEFCKLPTSRDGFDVRNVAARFLCGPSRLVPWIEGGGHGSLEFVQRDDTVGGHTYTLHLRTVPSETSPGPRRGDDDDEEERHREALYDEKTVDWTKLQRLLKKRFDGIWTKENEFKTRLVEYRRYLALNVLEARDASSNDRKRKLYDPSPDVDEVWRTHLSYPEIYRRDLAKYARELRKKKTTDEDEDGDDDEDGDEDDEVEGFLLDRSPCPPEEARARYEATLDAIESKEAAEAAAGGADVRRDHWPSPDVVFSGGEGE